MMPGTLNPLIAVGAAAPASFVFNGSDERLEQIITSSNPNQKTFTISFWLKYASFPGFLATDDLIVWRTDADNFTEIFYGGSPVSAMAFYARVGGSDTASEIPASDGNSTGNWYHYVIRVDTTVATAADRVRVYRNGSQRSPTHEQITPAQNADLDIFVNGSTLAIGAWPGGGSHYNGKLAFIDVAEGVSATPTDFAFDDGGVWTRKPYAGSHGSHGFILDGSNGFADFTLYNMDASNLDPDDLPPYIS